MSKRLTYVLAHDVGTSSVKTALITAKGEVLAQATSGYDLSYPKPGWVEQNPEDYWNACIQNTNHIIINNPIDKKAVTGIVFSTQAMGIIPLDAHNRLLNNNITWVDGRAEEEARWLMKFLGGRRMFERMIGVEITGKDVLPKLRWLKQHKPDLYQGTETILDVNGYLKFKATGVKVFEWSGACSYGFNLRKKDWERMLFKLAGVDIKKLPPLVRSTDVVGELTEDAAAAFGLAPGIPVYGGCDDTQSAAIGSGSTGEGAAHIYLGTSAWAGITTRKNLKHKQGAVVLQSADPAMNLLVGITESAGSNLDWLIEKFYKYEKKDPAIRDIFSFINQETKGIPAGSEHLVFTPWLLGERCPVSTTTTRGTLFNLGLEHTRGHVVKAMLEGVAYNLRWIFENYARDFRFSPDRIRAIGGGSVNTQWMQGIADISGKTVETISHPTMAGALGAASCAFVGSGVFSDFHQINQCIEIKQTFHPNLSHSKVYNRLFQSYKDVYSGLKKAYVRANLERFNSNL